ncbi:MAG: hypothetical protein MUF87_03930 [Anaerolineae bacterium]|jgi:hypothetical protein|nr:hypothetical protein [Anaerolineae bacterium]
MQKWEYCHVLYTYLFSKKDHDTKEFTAVYGVTVTYYQSDGQHKRVEEPDVFPETVLAFLGEEGWELVTVEYLVNEEGMLRRVYYLKRPKFM